MILADTGYFVALLNVQDASHDAAVQWSLAIKDRLVVTEYVAIEVVNFFSRSIRRAACGELIRKIQSESAYEWMPSSGRWFERRLALHQARRDKTWSLTDCISFEVMRERAISQALAHDDHFAQAGFDALLRRLPG